MRAELVNKALLAAVVVFANLPACRQDMHDQPRMEPLEPSVFFRDGRASRPVLEGTVALGQLQEDAHLHTGKVAGKDAGAFPFAVTRDVIERGRQRYTIFCEPCHGSLGDGRGMVVERGFRQAASFHIDRLRSAPPGYFFDVITRGFGVMYSYASRIEPSDRWAIVSYIRALQLSQNATIEDVPAEHRDELLKGE